MPSLSRPDPLLVRRSAGLPIGMPGTTLAFARLLSNDPEYRSAPLLEVAQRRRVPIHELVRAAGAVIAATRRADPSVLVPAPAVERMISTAESFDQNLARLGGNPSRIATSGVPGSAKRPLAIPHPLMMGHLLSSQPWLRLHPTVRAQLAHAGMGEATGYAWRDIGVDVGALPGDVAAPLYASDPDYQWFHSVTTGQGPRRIAYIYTGDEERFLELMDANPTKATVGVRGNLSYNWASLKVGEKVKIPKSWNKYVAQDGTLGSPPGTAWPPGPAPAPAPSSSSSSSSGGGYTSTLPDGSITIIKGQLGKWGQATGKIDPTGYPSLADMWTPEAVDESFLRAVKSFQVWKGGLRTDGILDKATHDALNAYTSGAISTPSTPSGGGSTPVSFPVPGVTPPTGGGSTSTSSSSTSSSSSSKTTTSSSKGGGGAGIAALAAIALGLALS